jgi:hypothetical protein
MAIKTRRARAGAPSASERPGTSRALDALGAPDHFDFAAPPARGFFEES